MIKFEVISFKKGVRLPYYRKFSSLKQAENYKKILGRKYKSVIFKK